MRRTKNGSSEPAMAMLGIENWGSRAMGLHYAKALCPR
jgi:hypothetical protein